MAERRPARLAPVDMNKAFMENNIFYQEGLQDQEKKEGMVIINLMRGVTTISPFEHTEEQLKFAEIEGITVTDDKPVIDISAPIFKQGHKPFDFSKVGVLENNE